MFSSLTSFLPSALQNIGNNQPPPPSFVPVDDGDPDNDDDQAERERRPSEEEAGTSTKRASKRGPNETFIFVRPPPAKTNHPLNLQVQLVPPTAASRTYRQSIDGEFSNANDSSVSLTRTQSNRSDTSSYGSTASFASTASTSSTSARRTIIPLYNLQAHNVMTNTIVDAGTDAKVAKFQRRGIEVIDLVFLEPVEVWGERNPTRTAMAAPAQGQTVKTSRPVTPSDTTAGPGSSTTSLHSASHTNDQASISSHTPSHLHQTPTQAQVPIIAAPTSKRSTIFGKLFKKPNKDSSSSSSTTSLAALPATHVQASSIVFTRPSAEEATPTQSTPNPGAITPKAFIASATTSQTRRTSHIRNLSASLTPPSFVERLSGVKGISGGKGDKSAGRGGGGGTARGRSASPQPPLVGLGLGGIGLGRSVTSSSSAASTSNGHGVSEDGMLLPPQQSFHNSNDLPNEEREKEKEKERILRPPVLGVQPTLSFSYAPGTTAAVPPPPGSASSTSGFNTSSSAANASASGSVAGGTALTSGGGNGQASGYPTGAMMKSARALMYVWFVRKWLKKRKDVRASFLAGWSAHGQQQQPQQQYGEVDAESAGHGAEGSSGGGGGLLGIMRGSARNSILGGASAESTVVAATVQGAPGEGVEVRFEWRRSNAKKKRGKGAEREKDRDAERRGRRRSLKLAGTREPDGGASGEAVEASRLTKRLSVVSHQGSLSTSFSISDEGGGNGNGGAGVGAGRLTQSPARKGSSRTGTPTRDKDSDKVRDRTGSFSLPRGRTPERVGSLGGGLSTPGAADEGEESDPEDSETPWVCTLKIRRVGGSSASAAGSGSGSSSVPAPAVGSASMRSLGKAGKAVGQVQGGDEGSSSVLPAAPQVLKVKVGTLSPTPHHPKVVAMLKVPFPLPDVEVEKMVVRKRTGAGHSRPPSSQVDPQSGAGGLTLSAEEIKDVVCSTGLWLVVREGFGGVGKVTRKGDGWRIRA